MAGVAPTGPAEAAGLRTGDVIVRVNGQSLSRTSRRSTGGSGRSPIGQPLELTVWREGALETVTVRPRDRYATVGSPRP